jgi:hypothetical protein
MFATAEAHADHWALLSEIVQQADSAGLPLSLSLAMSLVAASTVGSIAIAGALPWNPQLANRTTQARCMEYTLR